MSFYVGGVYFFHSTVSGRVAFLGCLSATILFCRHTGAIDCFTERRSHHITINAGMCFARIGAPHPLLPPLTTHPPLHAPPRSVPPKLLASVRPSSPSRPHTTLPSRGCTPPSPPSTHTGGGAGQTARWAAGRLVGRLWGSTERRCRCGARRRCRWMIGRRRQRSWCGASSGRSLRRPAPLPCSRCVHPLFLHSELCTSRHGVNFLRK